MMMPVLTAINGLKEFFDEHEILGAVVLFYTVMFIFLHRQYRTVDYKEELEKLKMRLDLMGVDLDKKTTGLCSLFYSNYLMATMKASVFLYSAIGVLTVMLMLLFKSMKGIEVNDAHLVTTILSRAVPSAIALFTVGLLLRFNRYYHRVADFYVSRYHALLLSNALDGGQNIDLWIERSYHRMDMGHARNPNEQLAKIMSVVKPAQ